MPVKNKLIYHGQELTQKNEPIKTTEDVATTVSLSNSDSRPVVATPAGFETAVAIPAALLARDGAVAAAATAVVKDMFAVR